MTAHVPTYESDTTRGYTWRVRWTCTCGKTGAVNDGQQPATLRRARSAFRRHLKAVTA